MHLWVCPHPNYFPHWVSMFSKIVLEPCLSKRTLAQVLMTSILLVSSVLHLQYPRLVHCYWVGLPLRIICKLDIFLLAHFLVEAFGADVFQHRYYFLFLWHLERVYMCVCLCVCVCIFIVMCLSINYYGSWYGSIE